MKIDMFIEGLLVAMESQIKEHVKDQKKQWEKFFGAHFTEKIADSQQIPYEDSESSAIIFKKSLTHRLNNNTLPKVSMRIITNEPQNAYALATIFLSLHNTKTHPFESETITYFMAGLTVNHDSGPLNQPSFTPIYRFKDQQGKEYLTFQEVLNDFFPILEWTKMENGATYLIP